MCVRVCVWFCEYGRVRHVVGFSISYIRILLYIVFIFILFFVSIFIVCHKRNMCWSFVVVIDAIVLPQFSYAPFGFRMLFPEPISFSSFRFYLFGHRLTTTKRHSNNISKLINANELRFNMRFSAFNCVRRRTIEWVKEERLVQMKLNRIFLGNFMASMISIRHSQEIGFAVRPSLWQHSAPNVFSFSNQSLYSLHSSILFSANGTVHNFPEAKPR